MISRNFMLALTLPALTLAALAVPAARAAAADAACGPATTPGWDVAGRLSQREHCLNGQAQTYRDGATRGVQQRIQAGHDAIDTARTVPGQQVDRLHAAGTAEQSRLNALGQQTRENVAGSVAGIAGGL
jgi:hypothetical protein